MSFGLPAALEPPPLHESCETDFHKSMSDYTKGQRHRASSIIHPSYLDRVHQHWLASSQCLHSLILAITFKRAVELGRSNNSSDLPEHLVSVLLNHPPWHATPESESMIACSWVMTTFSRRKWIGKPCGLLHPESLMLHICRIMSVLICVSLC